MAEIVDAIAWEQKISTTHRDTGMGNVNEANHAGVNPALAFLILKNYNYDIFRWVNRKRMGRISNS